MLLAHPIICGFHLQEQDLLLLQYWLQNYGEIRQHKSMPTPAVLQSKGLHFIPDVGLDQLEDLIDWNIPLLLVGRLKEEGEAHKRDLYHSLFQKGLSAWWQLPHQTQTLIMPQIDLPGRQGLVFATTDDRNMTRHYRQLCSWAGLDLRSDFRDAGEIKDALHAIALENNKNLADSGLKDFPYLIILDLDTKQIDPLLLFHYLRQFASEYPALHSRIQLLITKDFQKPGLDPRQIDQQIRPWGRKIFHPIESLLVLLEALHLNQNQNSLLTVQQESCYFRNMAEILFGNKNTLIQSDPPLGLYNPQAMTAAARIEPFRWYYSYLGPQQNHGLVLAPGKALSVELS